MKINIEEFCEKKGGHIADAIFKKYGEDAIARHGSFWGGLFDGLSSGGYSRLKVEKEIYQKSLKEATTILSTLDENKLDDKTIETLQFHLQSRLQDPNVIEKMTREEMLAHVIKIYVIKFLNEKGLII